METILPNLEMQQTVPGWILDEAVGPNTKLRQGDLIRFDESKDALSQAGIIVTADCDIEQRKHARLLTLVSVISIKAALENYLLIEDCERKRDQIESFAFKSMSIDSQQDKETKITILRNVVDHGAPMEDNPAQVAASFVLETSSTMSVGAYKALMKAINIGPKKLEALRDQIRNRGDLLVLPNTEKLGVGGELAWIRHLWQVSLGDIAVRTSEVSSRPGERVARLDSPYRYRLTQLMAQVFSDIGLPNASDNVEQRLRNIYGDA